MSDFICLFFMKLRYFHLSNSLKRFQSIDCPITCANSIDHVFPARIAAHVHTFLALLRRGTETEGNERKTLWMVTQKAHSI